MKNIVLVPLVLASLTVGASAQDAQETPRQVIFHVTAPCECASCLFDARRVLGTFGGVHKVSLDVRHKRLLVMFEESKHPVSELANAFAALDLGENSSLQWPLRQDLTAEQGAANLARVPGVKTVVADVKNRQLLITFASKSVVSVAQLDAAEAAPKP